MSQNTWFKTSTALIALAAASFGYSAYQSNVLTETRNALANTEPYSRVAKQYRISEELTALGNNHRPTIVPQVASQNNSNTPDQKQVLLNLADVVKYCADSEMSPTDFKQAQQKIQDIDARLQQYEGSFLYSSLTCVGGIIVAGIAFKPREEKIFSPATVTTTYAPIKKERPVQKSGLGFASE